MILVTGGAGFIGSAVVRQLVRDGKRVINLDKLTYAGNPESLKVIEEKLSVESESQTCVIREPNANYRLSNRRLGATIENWCLSLSAC